MDLISSDQSADVARPVLHVLADLLEQRIDETIGWSDGSRLYGISVLDLDEVVAGNAEAARLSFLADGWVYDLLAGPAAELAAQHDALGLCCFGTATDLTSGKRRRCRTILVADEHGQLALNRVRGHAALVTDSPAGGVPDLVRGIFGRLHAPPTRSRA
jgi:hypothetical protein